MKTSEYMCKSSDTSINIFDGRDENNHFLENTHLKKVEKEYSMKQVNIYVRLLV